MFDFYAGIIAVDADGCKELASAASLQTPWGTTSGSKSLSKALFIKSLYS